MSKLEQSARQVLEWYDGNVDGASLAFTALREALAEQVHTPYCKQAPMCKTPCGNSDCVEQAEQEPVLCVECGQPVMHIGNKCYACCQKATKELEDALKASAPVQQAEQEPVGVFANVNALTPEKGARWEQMIDSAYDGVEYIHLYAAPVRTKDLP